MKKYTVNENSKRFENLLIQLVRTHQLNQDQDRNSLHCSTAELLLLKKGLQLPEETHMEINPPNLNRHNFSLIQTQTVLSIISKKHFHLINDD